MGKMRKIQSLIGLKGVLSIACLTTIAVALVIYTTSVTITPVFQFSQGATSDSWNLYINEIDQPRYLPGGASPPWPMDGSVNSYAFKVVTDEDRVCAVEIKQTFDLTEKFDKFDITVSYWDGSAWTPATLYNSRSNTDMEKDWINGLDPADVGYIRQDKGVERYYLVEVTYTYDIEDPTDHTAAIAEFSFTPYAMTDFN